MNLATLLNRLDQGPSPYRKDFLREQQCTLGFAGLNPVRRMFVV